MTKRASKSGSTPRPTETGEKRPPASTGGGGTAAKIKERSEKRKLEQQRERQRLAVIALVVVGIIGLMLVLARTQPADAPIDGVKTAFYAGLEQGRDENGLPRLGSADAPNRIVEYSSFGCPACRTFHDETLEQVLAYVRSGQASFTFVPQFTGGGNVEGANRTALCALEQNRFWEMHDILFDWQGRFSTNAFNENRLRAGVQALGLDETAFFNCFNTAATNALIDRLKTTIRRDSTPTITINGVDVANALDMTEISSRLGGPAGAPLAPATEEPAATEAAPAATAEAPAATEAAPAATTEAAVTAEAEATAEATEAGS
ncbi:MAG: DsbA family protein [Anaerolineae bacterium]|jgi:hypothetical protein|nr:DsbA family protein [Anaerolineae bacterium]